MDLTTTWIICSVVFGVLFIIATCFFVYKIFYHRNNDCVGVTNINVSLNEVKYCMGWIWKFAFNERTGQMKLSIFILWYIVSICIDLAVAAIIFLVIYNEN